MNLRAYRVDVPEGVSGEWRVKKMTVKKRPHTSFHMFVSVVRQHGRYVPPGTYTGLLRNKAVIMSDTPDEMQDMHPVNNFSGHVLVGGLGLGAAVGWMLEHTDVERVTVVEKSLDVIKLTADHWKQKFGERLRVEHGDIFEWEPPYTRATSSNQGKHGKHFDHAWLDIWNDISVDNMPEFYALRDKHRSHVKGNIECWSEAFLHTLPHGMAWLEENDKFDGWYCDWCGDPGGNGDPGFGDYCDKCEVAVCQDCIDYDSYLCPAC